MVSISIMSLYNNTKALLKTAGIENYRNEAGFLVEKATGIKKFELGVKGNLMADEYTVKTVDFMVKQRLDGQPLQYILGMWEFYGLPFYVGEGVLIPRQDTETLVDTVISLMKDKSAPVIYDLCSGSGCIAISLEKNLKSAKITAVEKSEKAVCYLEKNKKLNDVKTEIITGDVFDKNLIDTSVSCDAVVSNPPYLSKNDMGHLQKEVTFEPSMALDGGDDGLFFYCKITEMWKTKLVKGGLLAFEIGIGQEAEVERILKDNGFTGIETKKDLCGIVRVVYGFTA